MISGALGNATDLVILALGSYLGAGGILSGAYTGSVDFYFSCDNGVTFERTVALWTPAGSSGTPRVVDSVGSNSAGFFQFLNIGGATHVALRNPTWGSGSTACTIYATPAQSGEVTFVGVDGINGPQAPRFGYMGGVDTGNLGRCIRLASKTSLRDLGATVQIKGTAGTLFGVHIENNQAAAAWIQIFDLATAVTLGTTNPDLEKLVAANASADLLLPANGVLFPLAIKIASTTGEKGAATSAAGVLATVFYA